MVHMKKFPKFFKNAENRMVLLDKLIESEEEIKCLEKLLKEAKERKRTFIIKHGEYSPGWGEWFYDYYFDVTNLLRDYLNYYASVQTNKW